MSASLDRRAPTRPAPDTWAPLVRAGSVAAAIGCVLYLTGIVVVAVQSGYPADGEALLRTVHARPVRYATRQLLWLAPGLALAVVSAAVALAHRRAAPVLAATAGVLGVGAWLLSFAWPTTGDGSLAVLWLADGYASAPDPAARAPFVGAADLLVALNDAPSPLGVLQTTSIALSGALVLRAGVRGVGWLGVTTGVVGAVCEVGRPWLGWGYAAYGLLLLAWLALLARDLRAIADTGRPPAEPDAVDEPPAGG